MNYLHSKLPLLKTMPFTGNKYEDIKFQIIPFSEFKFDNLPAEIKPNVPHYIDFNLIVFFQKKGKTPPNVEINFNPVPFSEGEILIVPQKSVISFEFPPGALGYSLIFNNEFFEKLLVNVFSLFRSLSKTKQFSLTLEEVDHITTIYQLIDKEYNLPSLYNKAGILMSLVKSLLLVLERKDKELNPVSSSISNLKKKFDLILSQNHNNRKPIEYYCQQLGCTYATLNQLCYTQYGASAKKMLNKQLLFEAKKLLLFSDLSIKEIAYHLEFSESTNFSKFFKRMEHQTPSDFLQNKKYLI